MKSRKQLLLLLGKSRPLFRVDGQEIQTEIKGILPDDLIHESHLEGGTDHTTDGGDGIPEIAVIEKLDEPVFDIGHFHVTDNLFAEIIPVQNTGRTSSLNGWYNRRCASGLCSAPPVR